MCCSTTFAVDIGLSLDVCIKLEWSSAVCVSMRKLRLVFWVLWLERMYHLICLQNGVSEKQVSTVRHEME